MGPSSTKPTAARRNVRSLNFFREVWVGFRPYLVKILIDLLISSSLWLVVFAFKSITTLLAVDGWVGTFMINLHSAGMVAAIGVFALLFAADIYSIHKDRNK